MVSYLINQYVGSQVISGSEQHQCASRGHQRYVDIIYIQHTVYRLLFTFDD